jgi:hypothetical protein
MHSFLGRTGAAERRKMGALRAIEEGARLQGKKGKIDDEARQQGNDKMTE